MGVIVRTGPNTTRRPNPDWYESHRQVGVQSQSTQHQSYLALEQFLSSFSLSVRGILDLDPKWVS
jgi:hypothetical protein